jgi:two-component system chemotaxis response regulator CheB
VKLMAEVKVVKRWPHLQKKLSASCLPELTGAEVTAQPEIVVIGASTGGPVVIQTILAKLSNKFPLPLLIVQHMAKGFVGGFAEWLAFTSPLPVHVASQGEVVLPGHVYIAPDGCHMLMEQKGRIRLSDAPAENGLRPAVAPLFRSVADSYGKSAVGVLLTGMGSDGAEGLLQLKREGAVTIAQDKASSVIYGMPGEAVRSGAATHVLDPERIAALLEQLAKKAT